MFKVAIAIVAAVVTSAAFASTADARAGGSFYASPFFRNQGRQPAVDPSIERRKRAAEEAAARARARKLETAKQSAARQAAAARRARIAEQQRREAARDAASKNAASAPRTTAATGNGPPAAKREDRLPTATSEPTTTAAATTATATTAKNPSTADTAKPPAPRVCRKYSAAADGLIETPCN